MDTPGRLGDIAAVKYQALSCCLLALFVALGACTSPDETEVRPDSPATRSGGAPGGSGGGPAGGTSGGAGSGGAGPSAGSGGASSATPDAAANPDAPAAGDDAEPGTPDGNPNPPPVGMALESFEVPASGEAVASKTKLDTGELFLLKAVGVVDFGGSKVDAEYAGDADMSGGTDVGIDTGMKELILPGAGAAGPMTSANRMKWFGGPRADHTFYMVVIGAGAPASLKLIKPAGASAGTGSIAVSIYRLTPMAEGLGKALETVMVILKPKTLTETSMLKPAAASVYLLRAFGESQVGGAGNNGDADFDDYKSGTSANEGEGGKDFGICIDEPCSIKRMRKWGPFRKDHNYYMLYAGNGMAINFAYCDTGYNDNAGSLPVEIYNVP